MICLRVEKENVESDYTSFYNTHLPDAHVWKHPAVFSFGHINAFGLSLHIKCKIFFRNKI